MKLRTLLCLSLSIAGACAQGQVVLNQIDTFSDLTTAFWGGGANPTVINTGGPNGAGDAFLQFTGSGGSGTGSVPAITNTFQWSGDFITPGVKFVQLRIKNFSSTPLRMRLTMLDDMGARWTTTNANSFDLAGNSGWLTATYRIDASGWVSVLGSSTWEYVSTHVTTFLLRNDGGDPSQQGQGAAATVGVDNITAIDGITVTPSGFSVASGLQFGGTLASLQNSDNSKLGVLNQQNETVGELIVEGQTTYLNPATIRMTIETTSTRKDITEIAELFNFSSGFYSEMGIRVPIQFDSTATYELGVDAPLHISGAGLIRGKLTWIPQNDLLSADGWVQRTDLVRWKLVP